MKDFFSPTAQARHHTVLHPPTSRSLPEKTILPLHLLEIRDLNGGVSSEKMDRTQLMCFFFPLHLVGIHSCSQLCFTRDTRVMNPKRKSLSMFIFFLFFKLPSSPKCLCCHEPQILDSARDLLKDSKLTPNFINMSSISYLLIAVCTEGEEGFRA